MVTILKHFVELLDYWNSTVICNRHSPLKEVHNEYTSLSCKKKMFIQNYVNQCCKIAMSTVNGEGVYIDDSFIVDIVSYLFRSQNLVTLLDTTHSDMFSEFSSQW